MTEIEKRELENFYKYFKNAFCVMVYDITRYPITKDTNGHILPIHLALEQDFKRFKKNYEAFGDFEKKKETKLYFMALIRQFNKFYNYRGVEIGVLDKQADNYRRLKVLVVQVNELVRNKLELDPKI